MSKNHLALPIAGVADQFLLKSGMAFLNHGSFGACPRPVFDVYQSWQRELEAQPVEFLGRRITGLLAEARAALGAYVGARADDLAFVPNATYGVNIVARSLDLQPGDEVLATDHEYGAVDRTWRFICGQRGARYINQPVDLPLSDPAEVVERLWAGVTPRTRIIVVSHISSPTALIFPVAAICARARAEGILTLIDGAHAPGQIDLDMGEIGADFYTGNCHKWLCAPKGAGFLYAREESQPLLKPLVVSWGYEAIAPGPSLFVDHFGWTGTFDPAAYLSVPAAIAFQAEHGWPQVRAACRSLLAQARARVADLGGQEQICPDGPEWWAQLAAVPLPPCDPAELKRRLWDEFQVEVPIVVWRDMPMVRISVQAYNSPADIDRLVGALGEILG
ncbi:aminotransferase class V-fold PLP-dependent enzyme [Oscillochloris sp. ZM17-4]|uniref:aminotransferase class V-fold PLP-dependent enzyme n=1 Tax=Oscillochloris sp. ZM17-4 TaxID=2866714 RepID=UPI001C72C9B7|nr:aminotransferase class V-fold PLP-dependent enzyme [Oscillochloris sp. ZM17-4]MBX0329605.1 aminotransferase class V-fold PLP-dependent enzyme [Oscillochloris sp. ZM17-4]